MKHRLHKWFAVSAGVFIMAWCLSGIAMILPVPQSGPLEKKSQPSVNYSEVPLSPAEAVTKLSKVLESSTQVSSVTMLQIRDSVAYRMTLQSGESYLPDERELG